MDWAIQFVALYASRTNYKFLVAYIELDGDKRVLRIREDDEQPVLFGC
jgi:hypothetical protein